MAITVFKKNHLFVSFNVRNFKHILFSQQRDISEKLQNSSLLKPEILTQRTKQFRNLVMVLTSLVRG